MKLPKQEKRYCKTCKKHTLHKIESLKTKGRSKSHPLSKGSTKRIRKRGRRRGAGNYGRYSKPTKPKRTGAKSSKKTNLKYTCTVCKKSSLQKKGIRTKKIIFE